MKPLQKLALVAGCCVIFGPLESSADPNAASTTYTVTMENVQFNPGELTVHRGDRIVWLNKDFFPHTVTANDHTFDSGSIDANGSWALDVDKVGDHSYGCNFHPTMKGAIHVR